MQEEKIKMGMMGGAFKRGGKDDEKGPRKTRKKRTKKEGRRRGADRPKQQTRRLMRRLESGRPNHGYKSHPRTIPVSDRL